MKDTRIGTTGIQQISCVCQAHEGLEATGEHAEPHRLLDADGVVVEPVVVFLRELLAAGRSAATLRSYGMDLLRWWRFLHAVEVGWGRATRTEARDFSYWIQLTAKQRRGVDRSSSSGWVNGVAGAPNPITGKPALVDGYAPATVAHSETVLRGFYDFHRDAGTGPILNPFPLDPSRRYRRAHAHHNPMDGWARERVGRYRPKVPHRIPRAIPDHRFNELFAALGSNRDRALVAFWISTGVRASELLGVRHCDIDPHQQLITVVRKGTRATQQVPASADAFVWLRLYQEELHGQIPRGRTQRVWWTLRRPRRPLNYHAAHRIFERANAVLGADWTLHDLRHSAARQNGPGSAADAQRRAVGHGTRASVHHRDLPDTEQGRGDRRSSSPSCPHCRSARRAATAGTGLRPGGVERVVREGPVTSSVKHSTRKPLAAVTSVAAEQRLRNGQLRNEFPPGPTEAWWPHTAATAEQIQQRLTSGAFVAAAGC